MFCQECKMRPATVHMTRVINNDVYEVHLCVECAQRKMGGQLLIEPQFVHQHNIFTTLLPALIGEVQAVHQFPKISCQACGCTFHEFVTTGYLGCSSCYKAFEPLLEDFLRKIHGAIKHVGKILKRRGANLRIKRDVKTLKGELENAVAKEDYEKAAELRDKLKGLERENEK